VPLVLLAIPWRIWLDCQYAAFFEKIVNIPDWTKLSEEVEELLDTDVVAVHY
jgi:hypothetical protein